MKGRKKEKLESWKMNDIILLEHRSNRVRLKDETIFFIPSPSSFILLDLTMYYNGFRLIFKKKKIKKKLPLFSQYNRF